MSGQDDDTEKEHEASQKKLDEARKRGDVAKSMDLVASTSLLGLILATYAAMPILSQSLTLLSGLLANAPEISAQIVESSQPVLGAILWPSAIFLTITIAVPGVFALASLIVQRAIVFSPEKLSPKLSQISPVSAAKKKFGAEGLFEFGKSFAKMMSIALILGWFLHGQLDAILASAATDVRASLIFLFRLLAGFGALIIALLALIGGIDLLWQRHARLKRNRMSRKEVQDEHKESEGDPHAKAERKQRAQELAMNQISAEVAKSNVVIVNPTHYAVALAWHRGSPLPPVVMAKGVDETAFRIREAAKEHGVPIQSDPPTARAVYATIPVGSPIRKEHFKAVAAAMRFAELVKKKSRGAPK